MPPASRSSTTASSSTQLDQWSDVEAAFTSRAAQTEWRAPCIHPGHGEMCRLRSGPAPRAEEKESCFLVCVSQCLRCLQMAPDGGKHSLDQFMEVRGDCQISRGGQTIEQPLVSVDRHAEELAIECRSVELAEGSEDLLTFILRRKRVLPRVRPLSRGATHGLRSPLALEPLLAPRRDLLPQGVQVDALPARVGSQLFVRGLLIRQDLLGEVLDRGGVAPVVRSRNEIGRSQHSNRDPV